MEFRKLISFGKTSFIISLPKSWVLKNKLKKGDLIAVEEDKGHLVLHPEADPTGKQLERAELNISKLGLMTSRYLHALYKKGIDELDISFDDPKLIEHVQNALGKEVVGYEIIDQRQNKCIIKNITGGLEGFGQILRRMFLMLISMADESLDALNKKELERMRNIALLEESNNRFTTSCRRILNKKGYEKGKIGPLYYIIEDAENIADQYKYLCNYFYDRKDKNLKLSKDMLDSYKEVNDMLRAFYELFYKFDSSKIVKIGDARKKLVNKFMNIIETSSNKTERVVAHNLLIISQKIFCLTGPFLVNAL
ncbi:hypothetical protein GOV06_03150 [Candidatus Woesearchaeota archaeon]|nr:hypothetical protein [Candidatus Woesearchaeota archaeon]